MASVELVRKRDDSEGQGGMFADWGPSRLPESVKIGVLMRLDDVVEYQHLGDSAAANVRFCATAALLRFSGFACGLW